MYKTIIKSINDLIPSDEQRPFVPPSFRVQLAGFALPIVWDSHSNRVIQGRRRLRMLKKKGVGAVTVYEVDSSKYLPNKEL